MHRPISVLALIALLAVPLHAHAGDEPRPETERRETRAAEDSRPDAGDDRGETTRSTGHDRDDSGEAAPPPDPEDRAGEESDPPGDADREDHQSEATPPHDPEADQDEEGPGPAAEAADRTGEEAAPPRSEAGEPEPGTVDPEDARGEEATPRPETGEG